ncbi:hypothetical protein F4820DRAFT_158266 [Hypoxylon rubiginosum]|uniref:Uncharacterized protein n=1 Tax=Hypoxylon rubiginosum TaxID=110542 RepID=A0ACB9YJF4_9PEZI|nr:hypothetical protein F4820DRAFT_158266 [Hypoxylon rubiginosum]
MLFISSKATPLNFSMLSQVVCALWIGSQWRKGGIGPGCMMLRISSCYVYPTVLRVCRLYLVMRSPTTSGLDMVSSLGTLVRAGGQTIR